MTIPARNTTYNRGDGTGKGGERNNTSASGAVSSLDVIDWWTEEESRLYTEWASAYANVDSSMNPYFDYFYTGQDVCVNIEGLTDPEDKLCTYSFGYSIQQQKQPVYGFWSYTYDGVLRGTRIITGAFSIIFEHPEALIQKIATASAIRARAATNTLRPYAIRGLDEDEANIERYWRRHMDSNLRYGQKHLFSIHPPFNFIIRFGLQTTSLSTSNPTRRADYIREQYQGQAPIQSNINERLIPHQDANLDKRILLENVEITSKSVEYNVNGDPILETYTFMARDERIVSPKDYAKIASYAANPRGDGSGSLPIGLGGGSSNVR